MCIRDRNDIIINSNQAWSNSTHISGNLIIESGATLTINPNSIITFSDNSKVIVEPNGKLELFGTLTSGCHYSFWLGVEIWGSESATNQLPSGGVIPQGRIVMHSNSLIENAKTAVKLYHPELGHAGGQIVCNGANFINNEIGVDFAPFTNSYPWNPNQPIPYAASFRGCTFEVNDNFPHSGIMLEDTLLRPRLNAHILLKGVDGIQIRGCKFFNNSSFRTNNPRDFGYGIFSDNSSFKVIPFCSTTSNPCNDNDLVHSEFIDMGYGVYVQNSLEPFEILDSKFWDCHVGVRSEGVHGELLFNELWVGDATLSTSSFVESFGFVFNGDISGLVCEENYFRARGHKLDQFNVGLLMDNTGNNFKEVRRNSFFRLDEGILVQNVNFGIDQDGNEAGLLILCNENDGNDDVDIKVAENGSLDWDQGIFNSIQDKFIPASNVFSNRVGASRWDGGIVNNGDEELRYHINDNAGSEYYPTPVVGQVLDSLTSLENFCTQNYYKPSSGVVPPIVARLQLIQKYQEAEANLALIADDASELGRKKRKQLKSEMDTYAYQILIEELNDSLTYSDDKVIAALKRFKDYQSELSIAKFYISQKNWGMATQTLTGIANLYALSASESTDLNDFNYVYNLVSEKDLSNLDSATLANLYDLDQIGGNAQTWVRSMLTLHGAHYPLELTTEGEVSERSHTEQISKKVVPGLLSVFPNPASDYVRFITASSAEHQTLMIRDLNGRILFRKTGFSENETVDWLTEDNPSGIYIYQLVADTRLLSTGKIILNK